MFLPVPAAGNRRRNAPGAACWSGPVGLRCPASRACGGHGATPAAGGVCGLLWPNPCGHSLSFRCVWSWSPWLPRGMKKAGSTCGAPGHACHARRPPKLPGKSNRSKKAPRWNGALGILQGWRPGAGGTTRPRCVWHTGRKGPRKPKPIPGPRRRGPAPDEGGHCARRPWWAALRDSVRCWRSCGTCVRCRRPGPWLCHVFHGAGHPCVLAASSSTRRGRLRHVPVVTLQTCRASPGGMGARIGGAA